MGGGELADATAKQSNDEIKMEADDSDLVYNEDGSMKQASKFNIVQLVANDIGNNLNAFERFFDLVNLLS